MRCFLVAALLAAGCVAVETYPPGPPAPPPSPPPSYAAWLGLVAYPARGQAVEQQHADDLACFEWARQETGVDPGAPPPRPPPATGSQVGAGAATGAVAGAVIGGIAHRDPVGGAVVGAIAGAVGGAAAEEHSRAQAAHAAGEAQRARLDLFRRGFAACMEGRGYTVR